MRNISQLKPPISVVMSLAVTIKSEFLTVFVNMSIFLMCFGSVDASV